VIGIGSRWLPLLPPAPRGGWPPTSGEGPIRRKQGLHNVLVESVVVTGAVTEAC
jgi:hypothetical protein